MKGKAIPVTIITGFLGSGKTTLLNNIIKKYSDRRIVVIENEFGEVNIDKNLIKTDAPGDIFELTNGCICCSIKNELDTALNSLILSNTHYDHLIIETTGIADPGDIIKTFIGGKRVQQYFELDTVVCLVDALHYSSTKHDADEIDKQLVQADLILLNKSDLLEAPDVDVLKKELRASYRKDIVTTEFANIDKVKVLNNYFYKSAHIVDEVIHFDKLELILPKKQKHAISTDVFYIKKPFKSSLFSFWIEQFSHLNKENIYRIKGIVCFHNTNKKIILQAVKDSFTLTETDEWEDEERVSTLVFIGTKISKADIEQALHSLTIS